MHNEKQTEKEENNERLLHCLHTLSTAFSASFCRTDRKEGNEILQELKKSVNK